MIPQYTLRETVTDHLIRDQVPMVKEDRFFYPDIETIYGQIHEGEIVKLVEMAIGEIEF
ncbi:hypothetical protein SC499_11685 [Peribacillus simplex]|nr:hypothetical protein [Peribacillus simplex]MDW7615366.1 hypothetical protein [Peribacillus simplex]